MKTISVDLFTFEELPAEVQKKVIEENRYINTEHFDWYHMIIDEYKTKLEELGFNSPDIEFSGFYSQGDGASFTCESLDMSKFLTGKYQPLADEMEQGNDVFSGKVERTNPHYVHERSTRCTVTDHEGTITDDNAKLLDELEEELNAKIYSINKEIYQDLKNDYEFQTSDDVVRECVINWEGMYEKDGTQRIDV